MIRVPTLLRTGKFEDSPLFFASFFVFCLFFFFGRPHPHTIAMAAPEVLEARQHWRDVAFSQAVLMWIYMVAKLGFCILHAYILLMIWPRHKPSWGWNGGTEPICNQLAFLTIAMCFRVVLKQRQGRGQFWSCFLITLFFGRH